MTCNEDALAPLSHRLLAHTQHSSIELALHAVAVGDLHDQRQFMVKDRHLNTFFCCCGRPAEDSLPGFGQGCGPCLDVKAAYDGGALMLRIPVAEKAQPRKIEITSGAGAQQQINA